MLWCWPWSPFSMAQQCIVLLFLCWPLSILLVFCLSGLSFWLLDHSQLLLSVRISVQVSWISHLHERLPFLVVTLLASWASDRYKLHTITITCSSTLSATGYIIYLCKLCLPIHKKYPSCFTGASNRYTLYGSLFLTVSGVYSISPVLSAWISNNYEPHYCHATAIALLAVFTNFVRITNFTNYTIAFFVLPRTHFLQGGILSIWLFLISAAPKYRNTSILNLVL